MAKGVYKKTKRHRNLIGESVRKRKSLNYKSDPEWLHFKERVYQEVEALGFQVDKKKLEKFDIVEFYRPKGYSSKEFRKIISDNNWNLSDIKRFWVICQQGIEDVSTYKEPEWHKWVYGSGRNPLYSIQ